MIAKPENPPNELTDPVRILNHRFGQNVIRRYPICPGFEGTDE